MFAHIEVNQLLNKSYQMNICVDDQRLFTLKFFLTRIFTYVPKMYALLVRTHAYVEMNISLISNQ